MTTEVAAKYGEKGEKRKNKKKWGWPTNWSAKLKFKLSDNFKTKLRILRLWQLDILSIKFLLSLCSPPPHTVLNLETIFLARSSSLLSRELENFYDLFIFCIRSCALLCASFCCCSPSLRGFIRSSLWLCLYLKLLASISISYWDLSLHNWI